MKIKIFFTLTFLSLLLLRPFNVEAKPAQLSSLLTGDQTIVITDNKVTFTFADLRYGERSLISPLDSKTYVYSTPPNWKFPLGGELELQYDVLLSGTDIDKIAGGGNLYVSLNEVLIGAIPLNETGNYKTRLQIPAEALVSKREDGRHILIISLDAQLSCVYDIHALVTIKPTSFFDLSFEESSPELDLSRLPAPFYFDSSFVPDSILVIVPDEPDDLELRAAMDVMAGFGSAIEGDYDIELVAIGQLSENDLAQHHLIFTGSPDKFDVLSKVDFQLPVANGQFVNLPEEAVGDGVLQLALSPWNPSKAVLLVSGNSGEAILKAGEAASSGSIFIYENHVLAYVSDVQRLSGNLPVIEDFSLKDLGYTTTTLATIGESSEEFVFYVAKEQVATTDGEIKLMYYHSGLLDYGNSSFSVRLNDQEISSIPFKEETQQLTTVDIKIPPGILRFGENILEVRANMIVIPSCDNTGFRDPWLTISDHATFHVPAAGSTPARSLLVDLKFFPGLFSTRSDLGDIAFVLPKSDPVSWRLAGKLAYQLGETVLPQISNLTVAYGDNVGQSVRDEQSMIVVGVANTLPLLTEINDKLPAPFDFETNTASEKQMQIIYRVPDGVSVGYLELMSSPFNNEKTLLVVAGNTHDGLKFAANTLLVDDLRNQLAGVFAVTNGTQIATGRGTGLFSIVGAGVPNSNLVVATPIPNVAGQPVIVTPPGWLMLVVAVSGLAIIIVIVFAVNAVIDKNRLNRIRNSLFNAEAESKPTESK